MTDAYERAKRDDEQWEREHGDTREKLEADIERIVKEHSLYWLRTFIIEWLDRQAAITTNELISLSVDEESPIKGENATSKGDIRNFADSREQLEAEIRAEYNGAIEHEADEIIGWLDRQAAITEREICKWWRDKEAKHDERIHRISELQAKVDELRAELDEYGQTHMELPVDADGVPIHLGDLLYRSNGDMHYCHGIGKPSLNIIDEHLSWWRSECFHHVEPRTVEDVLEEFIAAYDEWDDNCHDDREGQRQAVFDKYADELRWLGVCDD